MNQGRLTQKDEIDRRSRGKTEEIVDTVRDGMERQNKANAVDAWTCVADWRRFAQGNT